MLIDRPEAPASCVSVLILSAGTQEPQLAAPAMPPAMSSAHAPRQPLLPLSLLAATPNQLLNWVLALE
eukprot:CAMPEP_0115139734 /NCGR_PEP_ID=MMETSP0227-20121206/58467_1 /TAXON_ID=89957 /ORGANISM="Polarella glacialis, Strain CCMP 1383" /LENGTH=67 /DNA_ID=CAMNT_0002547659 /DNA_START=196 /DNA_END=399 /DNA_ORIENTATION=-